MRVLLSTYGSRGDVEPLAGLAVELYACLHTCELPSPNFLPSSLRSGPPNPPGVTPIEAIRAQGRRAILKSGWADLALIDDQEDCLTVGEVNQQKLFGRVAAVVHHGGAGTTHTAALAGAPQVVVPQIVDQPRWAARVVALGIGAANDGPIPTAESLSVALKTALTPHTAVRATAVAREIRTDGAAVAAKLLLDGSC
jgi:vancomycin aglycone glucosyltransferase